jgi:16S rRNA G966 N2-methylase RsmD
VVERRVAELVAAAPGRFDLVFADPPYAGTEHPVVAALAPLVLAPAGVLVLEREVAGSEIPLGAPGISRYRLARYGRTALDFYRFSDGAARARRGAGC